jgi:hypothetical protein
MEVACVMLFKPEGIFEKWSRGEDIQPGDFESGKLREWVDHELNKIAVREETHRVLTDVLVDVRRIPYESWLDEGPALDVP